VVLRTYSSVETLRHDVDRPVAHMKFELDFRVGRQEAFPYWHDHRRRKLARRVDPQTAHRTEPFLVQILQRAGNLIDCWPQSIEQTQAGSSHRNAARRTV
jgi:hypothetical protein